MALASSLNWPKAGRQEGECVRHAAENDDGNSPGIFQALAEDMNV